MDALETDEHAAATTSVHFQPTITMQIRTLSVNETTVHYVPLSDFISSKRLPTPPSLNKFFRDSPWTTRRDWQTSAEIYRVLNDLYTRQNYTEFSLVHLPELQLVAILCKEPPEFTELDIEQMKRRSWRNRSTNDRNAERIPETVILEPFPKPESEKEQEPVVIPPHVYMIPGNFTQAKLTGGMRSMLDEELDKMSAVLSPEFGIVITPGYIFAITDSSDQVCYYVERQITFEQLKASGTRSRDEELVGFFGKNRTINVRSLATRKAVKERREREEEIRLHEEKCREAERKIAEDEKNGIEEILHEKFDDDNDWIDENWVMETEDEPVGFDEFDELEELTD